MKNGEKVNLSRAERDRMDKAFMLMLYIPLNVLISDVWGEDKAKEFAPEFIDTCLSLYESVQGGYVSFEEMVEYVKEYSGITIEKHM